MQKRIILMASLLVCSVIQASPALDIQKITIQINDQLPGGTVYAQPYSGFYVDQLRKNQIETLEMTVVNDSLEAITITPSCFESIDSLTEKTAENGLLRVPRLANLVMALISLLLIAAWLLMYKYCPLSGKKRTLINVLLGLSIVGLPLSWVFLKIEDYIWTKIADNCLFESTTIQPGHTVKKFVFVDKNRALPQNYACQVADAQGKQYVVNAAKISAD